MNTDFKDSRQRKKRRNQTKTRSRFSKYSTFYTLNTPQGSYQPRPPPGTENLMLPLGHGITLLRNGSDGDAQSKMLCLNSKKLTSVPVEKLHSGLECIYLDDNKLTQFVLDRPLDSLKELFLCRNLLVEFPSCEHGYVHAPNLTVLDLSRNNFSRNGISIQSLLNFPSLERLDLSYTELKELPSDIGMLTHLKSLWINNNHLTELPRDIKNLNLVDFDASANDLRIPWQYSVDQGGFEAVKSFFESSIHKFSPYVKLILLGPAGVGKSVLRQALLGGRSNIPSQNFDYPDLRFELSVFDFANFSNHEIFFSSYSYFAILWDMAKYNNSKYIDDNVQYWIDLVQAKAPGSNILIIGTISEEFLPIASQVSSTFNSPLSSKSPSLHRAPRINISEISKGELYKEAESALWAQLDKNEELRVKDIESRRKRSTKTAVEIKLSRLLSTRPKIHPNIPLYLSTTEIFPSPISERRVPHSLSMKDMHLFQDGADDGFSRAFDSDHSSSTNHLSRTYSESEINHLQKSPVPRPPIALPSRQSTPSNQTLGGYDDGTGIAQLVSVIADLVHNDVKSLTISPQCIECTKYREYLNKKKQQTAPPYCTLRDFEKLVQLGERRTVQSGDRIVATVVEYWATLGVILKFDFNGVPGSDSNNIYLILDSTWLRECLSGLQELSEETPSQSFKNKPLLSLGSSQRLNRDRDNGFRVWTDIEVCLQNRSKYLTTLSEKSMKDTFKLLRNILEILNIIIPTGYRSLSILNNSLGSGIFRSTTPVSRLAGSENGRDFSSCNSDHNTDLDPDSIYLIPSLMLDGGKSTDEQKYPKAGCIQLERRVYLSQYFVPPDIIPRILAKVYSCVSSGEWDDIDPDQEKSGVDNGKPDLSRNPTGNTNSTSENISNNSDDMGLFYCWKTAFSQEIDHITISVRLSNAMPPTNNGHLPNSIEQELPTEGQYISISTTCHILLVHAAVRLITNYWEAVQEVLHSYPGLEFENKSLCPCCLMKQRPTNQCGIFDEDEDETSSEYSDEEYGDGIAAYMANANISDPMDSQNISSYFSEKETCFETRFSAAGGENHLQVSPLIRREYHDQMKIQTLTESHRVCPRGCEVIPDFYECISPSILSKLYPTEAILQEVLIRFISSQIRQKTTSSLESQISFGEDDDSRLYYGVEMDQSIASSVVNITACKYEENMVCCEDDDSETIISEHEEARFNGYIFDMLGKKYVITSVVTPNLTQLNCIYIVDVCGSSNELYAAILPERNKKGSNLLRGDTLNILKLNGAYKNLNEEQVQIRMNQNRFIHGLCILEIVSKISSVETQTMQTIINIPRENSRSSLISSSPIESTAMLKEIFWEGVVGMAVYILSYNKQRHLNKIYGRIVRTLPPSSRGDLRSVCLVSTKSASNQCVPGALVIDCISNRLIGAIMNADSRLSEVYFVGTP